MFKQILIKSVLTFLLIAISLDAKAEKFSYKNLQNIRNQLAVEHSDFRKIKNLGMDDTFVKLALHNTWSDLDKSLEFLGTLSYIHSEMVNKSDQQVIREVIEGQKRRYQGKCDFENEHRYDFKIEDARFAAKLNDFYKKMIETCESVSKWN